MNIGFHVFRDNYIKLYGPLVDFLLEKGWKVTLFCDHRVKPSEMGYKACLFPAIEKIPKFKSTPDVVVFHNTEELGRDIVKNNIKVFFVVNFNPIVAELKKFLLKEKHSCIFAELQYFIELLIFGKDISNVDVVYSYSASWEKWWKEYTVRYNLADDVFMDRLFKEIEKKTVVVGVPEADQLKAFNDEQIRSKYNIPSGKKLVLLFPFPWHAHYFPLITPVCFWTHIVYRQQPFFLRMFRLLRHRKWNLLPGTFRGINDLNVTRAIRAFCDKNDALLVVKGREKNPVPRYVKKMADYVFFDNGYYPFTTLELLFIADLSIGFWTMAIMESISAQTPSICLAPEEGVRWPESEDFDFGADFSPKPGSFYNFEGVVYNESVKDCISSFAGKTFEDYKLDSERKDEFVKKFLMLSDGRASERIYDDLVIRLNAAR